MQQTQYKTPVEQQLLTWRSNPDALQTMAGMYHHQVIAELFRQLERVVDTVPDAGALRSRLLSLQERRRELVWSRPDHVWLIRVGLGIAQDRVARCQRALDALEAQLAQDSVPPPLHYLVEAAPPEWTRWGVKLIGEDQLRGGRNVVVTYESCDLDARMAQSERVLALLRRAWPEVWLERHLLVREVVFVTGDTGFSSTLPATLGAVYLCAAWTDVELYVSWLHEIGHHVLHMRTAFDPLVLNGDEYQISALRPEPRRLVGHLHQVFVLVRMCEGLLRALPILDGDAVPKAREVLRTRQQQLARALVVLRRHARWTERGARLLTELQSYQDEMAVAS